MKQPGRTLFFLLAITVLLILPVTSLHGLDIPSASGGDVVVVSIAPSPAAASAEQVLEKTRIRSRSAARKLKGKHMLACQWVSWDVFGDCQVREDSGVWQLSGSQHSPDGIDFLKLDGQILEIRAKEFDFDGVVEIKVRHIDDGRSYIRRGKQTFRISGKRKYWRMVDKQRGPSRLTDYVDIYFR